MAKENTTSNTGYSVYDTFEGTLTAVTHAELSFINIKRGRSVEIKNDSKKDALKVYINGFGKITINAGETWVCNLLIIDSITLENSSSTPVPYRVLILGV